MIVKKKAKEVIVNYKDAVFTFKAPRGTKQIQISQYAVDRNVAGMSEIAMMLLTKVEGVKDEEGKDLKVSELWEGGEIILDGNDLIKIFTEFANSLNPESEVEEKKS
ncbi:MAG: hypothetical protein KC483_02495 [Nitrosarchaeum sp.]|nr:hypothetical protein [Nitrosarchaeum sp.]